MKIKIVRDDDRGGNSGGGTATQNSKAVAGIWQLAHRYNIPAEETQRHIDGGESVEDFQGYILQRNFKAKPIDLDPNIGLSRGEIKRYSLVRALNLLANNKHLDGLELEASNTLAKRTGRKPEGFFIPNDILTVSLAEARGLSEGERAEAAYRLNALRGHTRALNATGFSSGGALIGTDVLGGSMIDLLRNAMKVVSLGARMLTGLQGNVAIPKQGSGSTSQWLAESAPSVATLATFGQILLTPHRLAAEMAYSKQLLAQSSIDIEAFVRQDLMTSIAVEHDRAAIDGVGVGGEPLGLLNTTGINAVTFGGAPEYGDVLDFEFKIDDDNALEHALAWLTTPAVRRKWKSVQIVTGDFPQFLWPMDNRPNGYRAETTKQVPGNRVIFGNWNDLILAQWDGMDIVVDPYTRASYHETRIVINTLSDVGVRHPESFCASTDSGAQ